MADDWLTGDYIRLVDIVRRIGQIATDNNALDPEKFRLTMASRKQLVQEMRAEGWSVRKIAKHLAIDRNAVQRDSKPPSRKETTSVSKRDTADEDDCDLEELKRDTFISRCGHAHDFASYDGIVDARVVAAAQKVADTWVALAKKLKEKIDDNEAAS